MEGPGVPVLAGGAATWAVGYSCGISECTWAVQSIRAGARHARRVDIEDVGCDYTCDGSYAPRAALAAGGDLLVYSAGAGAPADSANEVKRIVGNRGVLFAKTGGSVESLRVGGGAVEAVNRVLVGDGCGCVDQPVWSPDGSKIAYLDGTFTNPQFGPSAPTAALAVMNADGTNRHALAGAAPVIGPPTWSPDGTQLAYTETSPSGQDAIAVVNADGSGAHELLTGSSPAWSPDGSKIAYAATDSNDNPAIFTMKPDGSNVQELASFPGQSLGTDGISWSPDGSRIAFSLNRILEVMNADGSDAHSLSTIGDEPAWSPDSSQIVFQSDPGLAVIGADGNGLQQLTTGPDDHPSWSPDGQTIVFGSDRDDPYVKAHEAYPIAYLELYLVDPDGSNVRPLSFTQPSAFEHQATFYAASGRSLPSLPALPALAGKVAAVGDITSRGDTVTLFNATSGATLGSATVGNARRGFAVVGADADWVVFHLRRTISALSLRSHHVIALTRAAATPLDLSVWGRRIAWVENIGGRGRIRALELPS